MQIKLLRDIGINGEHYPAGSVVEVDEALGLYLIGNGSATDQVAATPEQAAIVGETAGDSDEDQ